MAIRIVELTLGIVILLGATIYVLQQIQGRPETQQPAPRPAARKRRGKRLA